LALLIANSIVCYQLLKTWEKYWEEFCKYFSNRNVRYDEIINEVWEFITQSRQRLLNWKIKRLQKLTLFFPNFKWKSKFYYENMLDLRDNLAFALWISERNIKNNKNMKTVNLAVKMFSYWARNIYGFKKFPKEISIPIDSRLINLFEKYKWDYENINQFYDDLSKKLDIPLLHLDAILWVNYEKLKK
jgi:N-glycosylase/DNA lyase